MVEGMLKAAWVPESSGEVINLGSNVETRIIDLANMILELTGSRSKIEFYPLPIDDPKRRCPNINKAERLLGWKPKTSLKRGLLRTITWFRDKVK